MLAIGELQKSLGPDKAVTANSEILSAAPGKPNTTGVWESWELNPDSATLDYPAEKVGRFRRWLVSTPDPASAIVRDFVTQAWTGKTVELVGEKALGGTAAASKKVTAGIVPVSRDGKTQGAYAWHVSDESTKARINVYRDPTQNSTLARKRALLAGHRPDPSVMQVSGTSLDFLPRDLDSTSFGDAMNTVAKVTSFDQVSLLSPAAKAQIKQFRNDVTPYSLGILTDVRRGGLKQDLSSAFEMFTSANNPTLPSEFAGKTLYASTHGITGISDPNWSNLSGYYNIFRSITTPDTDPTFNQRPSVGVSITDRKPPTRYHPGPVIAKVEAMFSYVTRDTHPSWNTQLAALDPKMLYMGHLIYTPLVTLHNPYNVNISFDNLEVTIRNVPVAFRFSVNGAPQSSKLVPLTELFVSGGDRREKKFIMKIANWTAPGSTSTTGGITMKPGQTLVCGPYLNPQASFSNPLNTPFFDFKNNLTGVGTDGTIVPINAKPGYAGRCVGYDLDWLTPTHNSFDSGRSSDGGLGVLGLRGTDALEIEYGVEQPSVGLNTSFQVTAKITSQGRTYDYGGLDFIYGDSATLKKAFTQTFRCQVLARDTYVPNSQAISVHAAAKTLGVFSAYANTTSGGVYENNSRIAPTGAMKALRDGRIAGKPFLFNNAARTVMTVDMKSEKPGGQSHELNFQQFLGLGEVEAYFELDSTNRTASLMGNTTGRGIKSGSYLELPTGPMLTIADFRRSNALTSSYLPSFVQPVGNSMVSPLMSTDKVRQTDNQLAAYEMLDQSVLANHALYDRFYFSTFATDSTTKPDAVFEKFMDRSSPLQSQTFEPYLPAGKTLATAKSELFASGKPVDTAYQRAAEYQMVRGAFNVNSTSVQAWKAILASMSKVDITSLIVKVGNASGGGQALETSLVTTTPTGTPIMGMSLLNGEKATTSGLTDAARTNQWNGHRELSDSELTLLAEKIVAQVRLRGPFLSMSEFVNRQIGSNSELTRMGALEAAIGASKINDIMYPSPLTTPIVKDDVKDATLYGFNTPETVTGNPAAGAPGWISQGDLLRILEPAATVRSDTFVIRVCGEAWDAAGNVTARSYAEAVVQRTPEYIDPVDRPSVNAYIDSNAAQANKTFGRKMNVVSFRWLSTNEI